MKDTRPDTDLNEKFAAINRELRAIRILLYGILLLVAASVSRAVDRDLPLIMFWVGLFIPIVWTVIDSMVRRSRRARQEAEAFRRLSGRTERTAE